jgi:ATP synthase protein I
MDVQRHGVAGRLDQRQGAADPGAAGHEVADAEGRAHMQAGEAEDPGHGNAPVDGLASMRPEAFPFESVICGKSTGDACRGWVVLGTRMTGVACGCPSKAPTAILLRLRGALFTAGSLLVLDRSLVASRHSTGCRVLNSVTAGRRLARRAIAHQVIAVCATSLACLALGVESALAAFVGGGAVTTGAALSATWSLRRGVVPSGVALARMFVGVVLKWCLVFILFSLGLLLWRLPALPLLAGVLAALAAQFVAMARR